MAVVLVVVVVVLVLFGVPFLAHRESKKSTDETESREQVPKREQRTAKESVGVFISYRRQDEPNFAGRLYDRLAGRFGRSNVFMDVDTIELGLDFTDVINQSLSQCKVLIVVIGKDWLTVADADGEPRLSDPDDYVRIEIETALTRTIRVIPVLVEGAAVPKSSQLPGKMASLARRNGISMSHASFSSDADRLIETLDRIIKAKLT